MATHSATAQTAIDSAKLSVIAYNEKNWDAVRECLAPDATYDEVATARRLEGLDAILRVWKEWATAFPDSRASFESAVAAGDVVALELRWRGTHTGPLLPGGTVEPTGKPMDVRACQIVEMVNGKTRAVRHYFDVATLMRQLGIGG